MTITTHLASYAVVDEPILEFGISTKADEQPFSQDPQVGLQRFGPYSRQLGNRWHPIETTVAPICADDDSDEVIAALERMSSFERAEHPNWYVRTDFPGYDATYHSELKIDKSASGKQIIPRTVFDAALAERSPRDGYKLLIHALTEALKSVATSQTKAVAVVYLPRDIVTQFRTLTPEFKLAKTPKRTAKKTDSRQMVLFEELIEADEYSDTLYNDLRRAIKVRAMQLGLAVQILTDSFLTEEESQPWAGKFWNVSCSIFCKAGGIPWRLPTSENIAHCGIRFGVSKDSSGTQILVGVAQVFSASGELVAVRTGRASRGKRKSEAGYFLNREQAFDLVSDAIADYESILGRLPDRLLIHKSSYFKDEEIAGIEQAKAGVREIDLVYVKRGTPFRLMPPRGQPADRGTVVPTSDNAALLYLSGFISSERSWRGKHIPSPVEIVRCRSNRSLLDLAEEVLRLTKMNWNTTVFASRHPCTFSNATEMIGMMKELQKGELLHPQIRYYV